MCDELITALRTCVDKDKDCFECPYYERCMNNTSGKLVPMVDAADAIEKLIEVIQNHDFLESLIDPRWIPVTERLPDAYEDVLLKFPGNQAVGFCDRDGYWAVYSGDGFYTEVADNELKPTHWMPLPEPPKEE